ncbi:MAG: trypsin-like peptidase domain-containing protein [Firmicutes bacterium]|nr:trypsin-like peptidase domain-containing protein [Bacillota bacterium]
MNKHSMTSGTKGTALALSIALLCMIAGIVMGASANNGAAANAENLTALTLQGSGAGDLDSPFKAVYQSANESVVGIELTKEIFARNGRISSNTSFSASGVVLSAGHVVTNYHVIASNTARAAEGISIVYHGERYPAELLAGDETSDIAVLKAEGLPAPAAALGNSDALSVGDWALVIGNPLGEQFINTLTVGVISGLNRDVSSGTTMIQTNAQVNSGNSGGGLFNIRGELVGITSMKMSGYTPGGGAIEGFGFAVPINTVTRIADDLIQYGKVVYPRLGVTVRDIASPSDEPTKDFLPASVWVYDMEENSPARDAGIEADDLITQVGGERVRNFNELQKILRQHEAGDVLEITVYRVPNLRNMKDYENIPEGEFLTFNVELRVLDNIIS